MHIDKKKGIFIITSFIIVLAIAIFISLSGKENKPKFRTEKVIKGDIVATVSATGTVNAVITVLVGTQVSGTIKSIYVDFNSIVKKGQLIALIDPAPFMAQVDQARANLLTAKANVDKAEATLFDAKRSMDRNKELFSKNLIARSDLDTSETNHETAKAQLNNAKAQLSQAEALLRREEINLKHTKITSPVDGIVISRSIDAGQTVASSFQTPTLFTIAQDLTKMQIDTNVSEADIGKIKEGQVVDFYVDAYPEVTFKGIVSQIRNAPIVIQNVVTYDVVIKVDNQELKLKPGMTANVSIITEHKKNILKIPKAALRLRLSEKSKSPDKGQGVWIIEKGKPKRIKASIGISDESYTEIVSGDIKEGQELIVESLDKVKEKPRSSGPRMF